MAISRTKKEQIVAELIEIIRNYPYLYFVDLAGAKTQELTELRKKLAQLGAGYLRVKKTLLQLALRRTQVELPGMESYLGSIGLVYTKQNEFEVVKLINEFIKENNPKIKLKDSLALLSAFFEKLFLDKEQTYRLTQIPSREVLRGQLVNLLSSPLAQLAQTLNQVLVQFLITLKEIEKTKS